MKTSEQLYTAFSILLCGLLIFSIANLIFFIIPRIEADSGNVFKVICFLMGLYVLALGSTAFINLKAKELNTVSTVIQIVVLFLTGYGIPFGIWGIVLLIKSNKRANPSS